MGVNYNGWIISGASPKRSMRDRAATCELEEHRYCLHAAGSHIEFGSSSSSSSSSTGKARMQERGTVKPLQLCNFLNYKRGYTKACCVQIDLLPDCISPKLNFAFHKKQ
jgi:hypothetical protein